MTDVTVIRQIIEQLAVAKSDELVKINDFMKELLATKPKGKFVSKLKYGMWEEYYENENGKCDGEYRAFHLTNDFQKGHLHAVVDMINGISHGKYIQYYNSGAIHAVGTYKNGKLDGEWIYYNEQGSKTCIDQYKNGCQYRFGFTFSNSGELTYIEYYSDNGSCLAYINFSNM
jgi:antitoxin component YwqK of YwqJK toxin-antitoxin module